jgi:hypothetical protein
MLLVLAAASGVYLSVQASPRLLLLGAGIMIFGLAVFLTRGAAWRMTLKMQAETSTAEHWLRAQKTWLLRSLRRRVFRQSVGE